MVFALNQADKAIIKPVTRVLNGAYDACQAMSLGVSVTGVNTLLRLIGNKEQVRYFIFIFHHLKSVKRDHEGNKGLF